MSVVQFPSSSDITRRENPLNDMEDLLESSGYSHNRETENRLTFLCESKQSCYTVILEWHVEFEAVKLSVILQDCKDLDESIIQQALETANQSAWHGFFMRDGVGNIAFKSIVKLVDDCPIASMGLIENAVDKGIEEADRLYIALSLDSADNDSMFTDEEWEVENLALMFSDPQGNA